MKKGLGDGWDSIYEKESSKEPPPEEGEILDCIT
jgi:hypothetical protein